MFNQVVVIAVACLYPSADPSKAQGDMQAPAIRLEVGMSREQVERQLGKGTVRFQGAVATVIAYSGKNLYLAFLKDKLRIIHPFDDKKPQCPGVRYSPVPADPATPAKPKPQS